MSANWEEVRLNREQWIPLALLYIVSLVSAQQGTSDLLRIYLDVAWVGLRVGGCGVSGNPLGRVTSDIQFDDVMAIAVLCPCTGSGEGSTRNSGYL